MPQTTQRDCRNMLFLNRLLIVILSVAVTACGGGGSTGGQDAITLQGSVGDGPVVSATVTISDAGGTVLATVSSDGQAVYRAEIPADARFPLLLSARGGTDIVSGQAPDFTLQSVVTGTGGQTANLNPFTTLIVTTAQAMPGGLNTANLASAKSLVLSRLNFGLDDRLVSDPISSPVTPGNVANIVKASEALAETIRRSRDALAAAGVNLSEDQFITRLSADLSDGQLDGSGANQNPDEDLRIAVTTQLIAGQVLIEALNNTLKVNGNSATSQLDSAIRLILPAASQTTADVAISAAMLSQARQAIQAAQALSSGNELAPLMTALDAIGADSLPNAIVLPPDVDTALDLTLSRLVSASQAELNNVMDTITNNSRNNPPTISGSPPTTVTVGATYSFAPGVSDADGDTLTFSISNKPSWAAFNTSTGALTGTPSTGDIGIASGIVISVSDGISVTALPSFSITVSDVSGAPLNITGTSITAYQWDTLAAGGLVYVDRAYTYTTVPATYSGMRNLKTVNGDKASSGSSFLSFSVNRDVTVYIAHDTSIASKPSWLSTWTDTGDQLITSDSPLQLYRKDFPAGTIILGGNGGSSSDSMYVVLVSSAGGSGSAIPFATDDSATTPQNTAVTIDVLANDTGLADTPVVVSILSAPGNGTALVNPDNTITYTPTTGFAGMDTLNYRVTDADGDIATASATIQVNCATCAIGVTLDVNWAANPASENVLGYELYFGNSAGGSTLLVATIPPSASPSASFDAWNDLNLRIGDTACFRIKAYNVAGSSGFSSAACTVM